MIYLKIQNMVLKKSRPFCDVRSISVGTCNILKLSIVTIERVGAADKSLSYIDSNVMSKSRHCRVDKLDRCFASYVSVTGPGDKASVNPRPWGLFGHLRADTGWQWEFSWEPESCRRMTLVRLIDNVVIFGAAMSIRLFAQLSLGRCSNRSAEKHSPSPLTNN